MQQTCFSVRDLARHLKIGPTKILKWIHSGKLPAFNVSDKPGRPQYRIAASALENLAAATDPEPAPRRKKKAVAVREYY